MAVEVFRRREIKYLMNKEQYVKLNDLIKGYV